MCNLFFYLLLNISVNHIHPSENLQSNCRIYEINPISGMNLFENDLAVFKGKETISVNFM
ncbi:MAG TPA: hypothetical protein DCW34_06995 [Erysipelotrichaceae bacterium]|nr:hypothetical protein [Erysipelotrichaceae bacterium]